MKQALTARQAEMFAVIRDHIRRYARPPTVREIGTAMDIHSPNGVMCTVKQLVRKGWILKDEFEARGLRLTEDEGCCPVCGQRLPTNGCDHDGLLKRLIDAARVAIVPLRTAAQEMNSGYYARAMDDLQDAVTEAEKGSRPCSTSKKT